jgi:hypothetical protein
MFSRSIRALPARRNRSQVLLNFRSDVMKAHSLLITQRWLCLVLATATLAVVPCATAQEKEAPKELKSALVIVFGNAEKGEVSKVHRLTDAKQLAALEAFFPNYRSRPMVRADLALPPAAPGIRTTKSISTSLKVKRYDWRSPCPDISRVGGHAGALTTN